ncbi:hypothetical protein [Ruminococcus albus]|nr:hypothetical protein [Ruminococcus albus]
MKNSLAIILFLRANDITTLNNSAAIPQKYTTNAILICPTMIPRM